MLCDRCKNNHASIHLTEIIKDQRSEIHICEECAKAVGFNGKLSKYQINHDALADFITHHPSTNPELHICSNCGITTKDIQLSGKAGCPQCYEDLKDLMSSTILKNHDVYSGKVPLNYRTAFIEKTLEVEEDEISMDSQSLESLHDLLDEAVKDERYEDAALLRDRILEMAPTS
jgi:protein arginine kinase activator